MDSSQKISPEIESRIIKSWENSEHRRLRIYPQTTDVEYPVLGDLNNFIKRYSSSEKITVLDYGAGASPYRLYFPNADYRQADILETPSLRYRIGSDSRIAEENETFDLILSTQVLEHVENVGDYLTESFRLLKKGGVLILTTHGIWEEHGVPYDFQRWTEAGLQRDLRAAGYNNSIVYKLTCGFHAGVFLFIKSLFATRPPRSQPARLFFKIFRTIVSKVYPLLYRFCDKFWPEDKIVQASRETAEKTFYMVIAAVARK